jgi:hypothetical protein
MVLTFGGRRDLRPEVTVDHSAGNETLVAVSQKLQSSFRCHRLLTFFGLRDG